MTKWVEDELGKRRIGKTLICEEPEVWVSTVFLGPVEWLDDLDPLEISLAGRLFELMVFVDGKAMENMVYRFNTMTEARDGHIKMCKDMHNTFHGKPLNCS